MPKSKREEFARFEQALKNSQKKKPGLRTPTGIKAKDLFKPKAKEEAKPHIETIKEAPKNIDQLVEDAAKEIKTETAKDKDITSLFIEAQTKKQEGTPSTSRYLNPFSEATASGDVYGKAGKSTGGYAALATSNAYKTSGNGTYGAAGNSAYGSANDAYGSNAYGKPEDNAYKPLNGAPDFDKIENNLSGIIKLTPARKAHESHLTGNADPSCSYCKKAF